MMRWAIPALAIASAVACADVYSTNLDIPSGGSNSPTSDAPRPPVTSTGLLSPQPPPVCPDLVENLWFGDGGSDASFDGGGSDGGSDFAPGLDKSGSCVLGGAICEYGTSADRNCNKVFSCPSSADQWRQLPGERCAADQCPKNQAISALDGQPCGFDGGNADSDEILCNMSDGVCACTTGRGGNDVHARRWVCTKPLASCPLVRPNEGQPCQEGMLCDYGSCRSKRGMAMTCVFGVWGATTLDCSL